MISLFVKYDLEDNFYGFKSDINTFKNDVHSDYESILINWTDICYNNKPISWETSGNIYDISKNVNTEVLRLILDEQAQGKIKIGYFVDDPDEYMIREWELSIENGVIKVPTVSNLISNKVHLLKETYNENYMYTYNSNNNIELYEGDYSSLSLNTFINNNLNVKLFSNVYTQLTEDTGVSVVIDYSVHAETSDDITNLLMADMNENKLIETFKTELSNNLVNVSDNLKTKITDGSIILNTVTTDFGQINLKDEPNNLTLLTEFKNNNTYVYYNFAGNPIDGFDVTEKYNDASDNNPYFNTINLNFDLSLNPDDITIDASLSDMSYITISNNLVLLGGITNMKKLHVGENKLICTISNEYYSLVEDNKTSVDVFKENDVLKGSHTFRIDSDILPASYFIKQHTLGIENSNNVYNGIVSDGYITNANGYEYDFKKAFRSKLFDVSNIDLIKTINTDVSFGNFELINESKDKDKISYIEFEDGYDIFRDNSMNKNVFKKIILHNNKLYNNSKYINGVTPLTTLLAETFINLCEVEMSNSSDIKDVNDLCLNSLFEDAKLKVKDMFEENNEEIDIELIDKDPYSTIYDLSGSDDLTSQEKEQKIRKCRKLLDINMVINNVLNDAVVYDQSGNDNYDIIKDKKYRKEYSKRLMRKVAQDHMRYNGRKFSESINQNAENTNTPILIEIQKQASQVAEIDYERDISGHRKFGNEYFKGLAEMHKDFVNDLSNDNIDTYIEKQNNLEKIKKKLESTAELDPGFKNMTKQAIKDMFKYERDDHFEKEMILRQMPNYDDMPAEYDGPTIMPIRNKQGKFDILHRFKNTNKKFRKY